VRADLPLGDLARIAMLALRSQQRPARHRSGVIAVAAGVILAMTGPAAVAFLFAALWIWVRAIIGPAAASLIVAGCLALTALLSVLALLWASGRPAAPRVAVPAGFGLDDLSRLMTSNKTELLLAAALAGLVAAGSVN